MLKLIAIAVVAPVIAFLVYMDKMIGKDFDAGLADLKTVSERQAAVRRE